MQLTRTCENRRLSCSRRSCRINWSVRKWESFCPSSCHLYSWMPWGIALRHQCTCLKVWSSPKDCLTRLWLIQTAWTRPGPGQIDLHYLMWKFSPYNFSFTLNFYLHFGIGSLSSSRSRWSSVWLSHTRNSERIVVMTAFPIYYSVWPLLTSYLIFDIT